MSNHLGPLKLRDASSEVVGDETVSVLVENNGLGLVFQAEGYGLGDCAPGVGGPIFIERYQGELRVLIWGDINKQDPTHIISLKDARESNRNDTEISFVVNDKGGGRFWGNVKQAQELFGDRLSVEVPRREVNNGYAMSYHCTKEFAETVRLQLEALPFIVDLKTKALE